MLIIIAVLEDTLKIYLISNKNKIKLIYIYKVYSKIFINGFIQLI